MKIQGFDARSYDRIVTLVAPGLRSRSPFKERERAMETGGFLWVVFNAQTLEVALHSHKGVIEDSAGWTGPSGLQAFAEKHGAQLAIAVESAGLERFLTRWGARTDLQDSFVEQWLIVAENIRELIDEGALYTWPQLWPTNWPRPTAAIVETTFGLVFPHNRSVIILLNDEQHKVDTALVLVRDESGAFSHCIGPEMLRRYVSLESGSLVNDTQAVKRWVEANYAPVHLAIGSTTRTLHELLRTPQSALWLNAINSKAVYVDGSPPWLMAALAAASAQGALQAARGWLGSFLKTPNPAKTASAPVTHGRPRWTTELLKTWSGILRRTSQSSSTLEE